MICPHCNKEIIETTENAMLSSSRHTIPPQFASLEEYCKSRDNGVDPKYFFDYWEARGWKMNGNKKMVNWQAAVRTFERNSNQTKEKESPVIHLKYCPNGCGNLLKEGRKLCDSCSWCIECDNKNKKQKYEPEDMELVDLGGGKLWVLCPKCKLILTAGEDVPF